MALKLTRSSGESVVIRHKGEEIRIHFEKTGKKTGVLFDGPKSFDITRSEIIGRERQPRGPNERSDQVGKDCFVTDDDTGARKLGEVMWVRGQGDDKNFDVKMGNGIRLSYVPARLVQVLSKEPEAVGDNE